MCVAAAIGAAAVVGGVATTVASDKASKATKNAANQATQSENQAIQQQQAALQQQATLSAPYRAFGQSAIPELSQLLGITPQQTAQAQQDVQPMTAPNSQGNLGGIAGGLPVYGNNGHYTNTPQFPGQQPNPGVNIGGGVTIPRTGTANPGSTLTAGPGGYTNVSPGQMFQGGTPNTLAGYTPLSPTETLSAAPSPSGFTNAPQAYNQGVGTVGSQDPAQLQERLRNTPGYQFTKNEGLTSTLNASAASGLLNSGNTLEALDRFSTGLADSTYQENFTNEFNTRGQQFQQNFDTTQQQLNQRQQTIANLENVVAGGQAAAAGQAANVGNSANTIGGYLGNQGNIAVNQGNTIAGINANRAAGISNSLGNGVNNLTTLAYLRGQGVGSDVAAGMT